jgi:hypothetical protein
LVVFGEVLGEVVLEVDVRFLLIGWVLGLELLAHNYPQSLTWICGANREIDWGEGWVFSCGLSSSRLSRQNRSDRYETGLTGLAPVGYREEFSTGKSFSCCGFLCSTLVGFWGCFALGWLHWSFGDFLDKTGLTDLLNRPDWFPLPVSMVFYTDRYRTGKPR